MKPNLSHIFILLLFVCSLGFAKHREKQTEPGLEQEIEAEILFPNETEPRHGKLKVYYSPLADSAQAIANVAKFVPTITSGVIQPVPYILKQMKSVTFEYQEGTEKKSMTVPNPLSSQIADLLKYNSQGAVEDNGAYKIVEAKKIRITATQKFTFEYGDTFGPREVLKWMLISGQVDYTSKSLDEKNNILEKRGSVNIFKFRDPRIFKKFQQASNQKLVLPMGELFKSEVIYMGQSNNSKHIFIRKVDLENGSGGVAVYAIAPEFISQVKPDNEQLFNETFHQFLPTIQNAIEPIDYIEHAYQNSDLNKKVDLFQNSLARLGLIQRILPCQRFLTRLIPWQSTKPRKIIHGDPTVAKAS
jgi:hypothetical protein